MLGVLAGTMTIINHIHQFEVNGMIVKLKINHKNGCWSSEVIEGNTGQGGTSGGTYETLKEYVAELEKGHRYAYYFFNNGRQRALQEIGR